MASMKVVLPKAVFNCQGYPELRSLTRRTLGARSECVRVSVPVRVSLRVHQYLALHSRSRQRRLQFGTPLARSQSVSWQPSRRLLKRRRHQNHSKLINGPLKLAIADDIAVKARRSRAPSLHRGTGPGGKEGTEAKYSFSRNNSSTAGRVLPAPDSERVLNTFVRFRRACRFAVPCSPLISLPLVGA